MRAAWYEKQGAARDVLVVGEMPEPTAGAGEVRIHLEASGINPGDIKKRQNAFGYGMAYPRVIPHSDGAGVIDQIGEGVAGEWIGQRVWCYGAQSYRAFGTAAEYTVLPLKLVVPLPENVPMEQGACLGIPGITAYQAVHVAGDVKGQTILVQGGAGAVGVCAVHLAHRAGAMVIAAVRSAEDEVVALKAGADHVVLAGDDLVEKVQKLASKGVNHIIEVAFAANIEADAELLALGGSLAAYATDNAAPQIPFWSLVFKNVRLCFLGSDDFSSDVKTAAAMALNEALEAGWQGFEIAERVPLAEIAHAHELMEHPVQRGRVVVTI